MSASTYPLTEKRIESYEDLVADRIHLDQLREDYARMQHLDVRMPGFDKLRWFRKENQGTLTYDAWDPDIPLDRAVMLTRENAIASGMLTEIQEIIIDPNMVFILMRTWV